MTEPIETTAPALTEAEQAQSLNQAFDATGITYRNRAEALAAFKIGREIVYEDKQPFTKYDGVIMPLSDALARFAFDRKDLVDGRSLPREGVSTSRAGTLSKSDLDTVEKKVEYIREFGPEAFENLPLRPVDTSELRDFSQWLKLPVSERVRLTSVDPDIVQKLRHTKPDDGRKAANKERLERLNRVSPNLRAPGWSRAVLEGRNRF